MTAKKITILKLFATIKKKKHYLCFSRDNILNNTSRQVFVVMLKESLQSTLWAIITYGYSVS